MITATHSKLTFAHLPLHADGINKRECIAVCASWAVIFLILSVLNFTRSTGQLVSACARSLRFGSGAPTRSHAAKADPSPALCGSCSNPLRKRENFPMKLVNESICGWWWGDLSRT